MKRNIFKICLAALIVSGTFTSCSNDREDKFDELSSVRESKQAKELEELLFSADHGWKLQYFTDDTELGGYTFLMKFHGGNYVEMISDFDEDGYKLQGSEYQIQLRGTTALVFVTENKIHKLSDPYNSPTTNAEGYKGDFQFRYYGKTEEEIIFRGTKNIKKEIRFVKATAEDWKDFENRKPISANMVDLDSPIFRSFEITKGGNTKRYDGVFGSATRFFEFNENDSELGNISKGFGLGYTNDGAIISPSLDIDGVEIKNFKWDNTKKELVSINSGDVKVVIKNVKSPTKWMQDYKELTTSVSRQRLLYDVTDDIRRSSGNSEYFRKANIGADGNEIVSSIDTRFENGRITIIYESKGQGISYSGIINDNNGRITISNGSWQGSASVELKGLHDKLYPTTGFFLKKQSYKVKYSNVVWTIISGTDTTAFDSWRL